MYLIAETGSRGISAPSLRYAEDDHDIEVWIRKKIEDCIQLARERDEALQGQQHMALQEVLQRLWDNGPYIWFRVYQLFKWDKPKIYMSDSKANGKDLKMHLARAILREQGFKPKEKDNE